MRDKAADFGIFDK